MRQRAAVARAFAYPAGIMLMDEPLQALDLHRKLSLIDQFETLWEQDPRTSLFVTHDIQEAILLGDSIMVLGGPPAKIRKVFRNPLPRSRRSLKARSLMDLEQEMYGLLVENRLRENRGSGESFGAPQVPKDSSSERSVDSQKRT